MVDETGIEAAFGGKFRHGAPRRPTAARLADSDWGVEDERRLRQCVGPCPADLAQPALGAEKRGSRRRRFDSRLGPFDV
jgi:hypothetical protein